MVISWSVFRPATSPAVAPVAVPWGFRPRIAVPGTASGSPATIALGAIASTATGAGSAAGTVPALGVVAIDATATGVASASGTAPAVSIAGLSGSVTGGGGFPPPGGGAGAQFVGTDSITQGTWLGVYGTLGYYKLVGATPNVEQSLPTGLTVTEVGTSHFSWESAATDVRDLQRADGSTRDADTFFSGSSFSLQITPTDSTVRRLRAYCLDWPDTPDGTIDQTVAILDHATGDILDSRMLSTFANGIWLSWDVVGAVDVQVTFTGGSPADALLGGLFFDPASSGNASGSPASISLAAVDATATGAGSTVATAASVSLAAPGATATGTAVASGTAPSVSLSAPAGAASSPGTASGTAPSIALAGVAGTATVGSMASGAAAVVALASLAGAGAGGAIAVGSAPAVSLAAPAGQAGAFRPGDAIGAAATLSLLAGAGIATGAAGAAVTAPALALAGITGAGTGAALAVSSPPALGLVASVSGIGSLVFVPNFTETLYPLDDWSVVTQYPPR